MKVARGHGVSLVFGRDHRIFIRFCSQVDHSLRGVGVAVTGCIDFAGKLAVACGMVAQSAFRYARSRDLLEGPEVRAV